MCVCASAGGMTATLDVSAHRKKLDTDTQTAIFKGSWRQEADFDFSDSCSAEIVFSSGRKHWEISLPGQLKV